MYEATLLLCLGTRCSVHGPEYSLFSLSQAPVLSAAWEFWILNTFQRQWHLFCLGDQDVEMSWGPVHSL